MLNLFLGWTLVGWVVALVWAVTAKDKSQERKLPVAVKPVTYPWENEAEKPLTPSPAAYTPTLPDKPKVDATKTKNCPFCAEEILQAAIICKHCKSDVTG